MTYFAYKKVEGLYLYTHTSKQYVEMKGAPLSNIVQVEVSIHPDQSVRESKEPNYWGWLATGSDTFQFIWPSYAQFSMCFPYGWQIEAEKGEGQAYRLQLNEIR